MSSELDIAGLAAAIDPEALQRELAFYRDRCLALEDDLKRERKAGRAVRQLLSADIARRLADKLQHFLEQEDDLK